jgi:hypothetical protein
VELTDPSADFADMEAAKAALEALRARVDVVHPDLLVAAGALLAAIVVLYLLFDTLSYAAIPSLEVPLKQEELAEELDAPIYTPPKSLPKDKIPCYDPGTMQLLGHAKAMTPEEVGAGAGRAARCRRRALHPRRPPPRWARPAAAPRKAANAAIGTLARASQVHAAIAKAKEASKVRRAHTSPPGPAAV